ncbi:MAG TPA: rhomboid family intramembrane serine protease [Armatimonadota bacterium]|nr:rhomboid family intramembrane serine protease [Armatimonadota bacterium]
MRMIGHLEEEHAAVRFGAYLSTQGMEGMVRREQDGSWAIWVYAEPQIAPAREMFARYQEDPENPMYEEALAEYNRQMALRAAGPKAPEAKTYTRDDLWGGRLGVLTTALIGICVLVGILSHLGTDQSFLRSLFISNYHAGGWQPVLPEIRAGQVWRLVTPIFIHFGILHLLFNMLWLRDLGGMIERRRGAWRLAALVIVIAAASNLGQFYVSGPSFGGMSGVVYGLLGYIWMQSKYNPKARLYVHPVTMQMMIIWLVLCFTGMLGSVANTVHEIGLGVGLICGYLAAIIGRRNQAQEQEQ